MSSPMWGGGGDNDIGFHFQFDFRSEIGVWLLNGDYYMCLVPDGENKLGLVDGVETETMILFEPDMVPGYTSSRMPQIFVLPENDIVLYNEMPTQLTKIDWSIINNPVYSEDGVNTILLNVKRDSLEYVEQYIWDSQGGTVLCIPPNIFTVNGVPNKLIVMEMLDASAYSKKFQENK